MRQLQRPQRWIERRKQQVLGANIGFGQRIEQRRLAGIGIADESDRRERHVAPRFAMQSARALYLFELALDPRHPLLDETPVGFDLRLARTAEKAEATALALQVGPGANKTRFLITEMCEFDLQRAFARARPLAEDFKDQPGAVDDLGLEGALEIALLYRR